MEVDSVTALRCSSDVVESDYTRRVGSVIIAHYSIKAFRSLFIIQPA